MNKRLSDRRPGKRIITWAERLLTVVIFLLLVALGVGLYVAWQFAQAILLILSHLY